MSDYELGRANGAWITVACIGFGMLAGHYGAMLVYWVRDRLICAVRPHNLP